MYEITMNLDPRSTKTLYEQIYEYIRDEIRKGTLKCGERLPSTRLLASHLDVSRSTAQLAYEQLLSEGYIEAIPCKGYFVCQMEALYRLDTAPVKPERIVEPESNTYRYDFTPNGIDLKHFPFAAWRKLNREVLQQDESDLFLLGEASGEWELREVISSYLHQARGVHVQPEQVIVGAGNDYLLMLLSRILGMDHKIAMESPTYRHAWDVFQKLGYDCRTVSMDKFGMNVEKLKESGADIAYVMPSHQYPLGIVMPIKRRQELLRWAEEKPGRYLIEDDYDSEFRYIGKPIPSLQGNDRSGCVIYLGTFSKSIAPAIRISYLVLPESLLETYRRIDNVFSSTVSRLDQRVLQLFMEKGYYERHLNKMRALYKSKHDVLMSEIRKMRGVRQVLGDHSGVHILLQMDGHLTEQELIRRARQAGIKVYPLSEYCVNEADYPPTVILGYATLSEEEIREGVRLLAQAWLA